MLYAHMLYTKQLYQAEVKLECARVGNKLYLGPGILKNLLDLPGRNAAYASTTTPAARGAR